jgi:hypothetical protein
MSPWVHLPVQDAHDRHNAFVYQVKDRVMPGGMAPQAWAEFGADAAQGRMREQIMYGS